MAVFYPNMATVNKLKPSPTEGELAFLYFLSENLNDDYGVYFQPFVNGDKPDIILMKRDSALMIIEVKDWNLRNYSISGKKWSLKKNNSLIKSPLEQVITYKLNFYNLHIDILMEKSIKDKRIYSIITPVVYFHNETEKDITKIIKSEDKYIDLLGNDSLTKENFDKILDKRRFNKNSSFFNNDLYERFKRFLQPPFHTLEQGEEPKYDQKQLELSQSKVTQQKIKGVVGAGKTIVLAKRAVNAYKRTSEDVLILTYNITLRNYIHDNISKVRENFDWKRFSIINYHEFINSQLNNLNIRNYGLSIYSDINIFSGYENKIIKYNSIFIDEIQDYESEWIKIIKKFFLAENGEFVVFGDEKQNIYERIMGQDKKPNTTIPGRWSELSKSYRLRKRIANFAEKFQNKFFAEKYELDNIQVVQQASFLNALYPDEPPEGNIEYYYFTKDTPLLQLIYLTHEIIKDKSIHPNDICFLSSKTELLREIDFNLRNKEKTNTTFETKEMFDKFRKEITIKAFDRKIDLIRRNKKLHFWMNNGTMKLSTIHSFKGWEIPTLFLIITTNDKNDELIYTAISRCMFNLIVINIGNQKYDGFFSEHTDKKPKEEKHVIDEREDFPELTKVEDKIKLKTFEDIEKIEKEERNRQIPLLINELKGNNNKYRICILGEISQKKDEFEKELGHYFNKYGVRNNLWGIEFFSNKKIKKSNVFKSLKNGRSSYSLIVTAQLHKHSTKGNVKADLLEELKKDQYIKHIVGCSPRNLLTIDNMIKKLDDYINIEYARFS